MSAANDFAELPKQFLYNLAFAEVEMIFPKFDRTKVTHKLLIKDKYATVEFTPETKRFSQRILRGIYIAGDWTDTGLPATIESAAGSGKLAAMELIKDYF
jgi:Flavin containing amine oxidoreductase.